MSAHFKVDGASRRVDGKNDYICYTAISKTYKISKKVDGTCGMSSWGNRCAPSLADNAGLAHGLNARTANGGVVAKNMSLRSQNLPTSIATKISWWQMPGVICHRWQMYQERHEIVTKMHHLRSNFNFFPGGGPPDPPSGPTPLDTLHFVHCMLPYATRYRFRPFYHLPPENPYLPPAFQLWMYLCQ